MISQVGKITGREKTFCSLTLALGKRSPVIAEKADRTALYGISRAAACWRWLFQTWKFWRLAGSQYVLMYSPDGTNVYCSRAWWRVWGDCVHSLL